MYLSLWFNNIFTDHFGRGVGETFKTPSMKLHMSLAGRGGGLGGHRS